MRHFKFIFLILVSFYSCQDKQKQTKIDITTTERTIKRALLNGYYNQINENIGISLYQNNMYIFSSKEEGFSKDKFLLHLINQDESFINKDFYKDEFLINDSLSSVFSKVDVIQRNVNLEQYMGIRIGQFKRNPDQSSSNIWSKEIMTKEILDVINRYQNQLPINNLINEDFKNHLQYGKFFKTKSDFYILLSDHNLFFITNNNKAIDEEVMLHFIKEDNTFNNFSFKFEPLQYQHLLEKPYKNLKIVKIMMPVDYDYPKIRIGQFNENGNIWVQEFFVKDIYDNELLEYNNEFEE
ncbi:MAG: hypothetical protein WA749_15945 [Gelidibacter sp.]